MKILVTGGAGFIGSITNQELKKAGHEVIIFDSLEKGHQQAIEGFELVKGKTQDYKLIKQVLSDYRIEAVVHFAAFIEMGESYHKPYKYFYNNYYGSLQLLRALVTAGVKKVVFSSTAGVYGAAAEVPIAEEAETKPENPYGESKLMVEKTLSWFDRAYNLKSVSLRYFNAAGALPDGSLGEDHKPETHLIPNVIKTALGLKQKLYLYGNDYHTKDKTCIRDYIHVLDLASAHILALDYLNKENKSNIFNVGTGQGYSNLEIVRMVEKVTGKKVDFEFKPRRPGDTDILVALSQKIKKTLGWQPGYSDLETIIKTAFKWHTTQPHGYC
jgi:UDP-glucose 4-epimerase